MSSMTTIHPMWCTCSLSISAARPQAAAVATTPASRPCLPLWKTLSSRTAGQCALATCAPPCSAPPYPTPRRRCSGVRAACCTGTGAPSTAPRVAAPQPRPRLGITGLARRVASRCFREWTPLPSPRSLPAPVMTCTCCWGDRGTSRLVCTPHWRDSSRCVCLACAVADSQRHPLKVMLVQVAETIEEAVAREVGEEAGVHLYPSNVQCVRAAVCPHTRPWFVSGDMLVGVQVHFVTAVAAESHQSAAYDWMRRPRHRRGAAKR